MAKYRKIIPRIWTDPKTRDLTDRQFRVFTYLITGKEACTQTNSGIYEIHRSTFQDSPFGYSLPEIDEVMNYFNEKKPELFEYDAKEHIVYVKSFYKHNGGFGGLKALIEDFEDTYSKAPSFWIDFGQRYRNQLNKLADKIPLNEKLSESEKKQQLDFVINLVELKDSPNPNPKPFIGLKVANLDHKKTKS